MRFVPLVKARGGRVILRCQPPLGRLLAGIDGADQVLGIALESPLPKVVEEESTPAIAPPLTATTSESPAAHQ